MDHSKAHSARKWNKTSGEVHQVQSSNNEHDVHTEERKKKKLSTCTSGDGGVQRHLDYVMISEDRNWVKRTEARGQANINQMYQHKIIRMEINTALKKQEKEKQENTSHTI